MRWDRMYERVQLLFGDVIQCFIKAIPVPIRKEKHRIYLKQTTSTYNKVIIDYTVIKQTKSIYNKVIIDYTVIQRILCFLIATGPGK